MKRFKRISKIHLGKTIKKKTGFVLELKRLIDIKQKVPLQYIH